MRTALTSLVLTLSLLGRAHAGPPRPPDVVSGSWIELRDGKPTLVVALYRREGTAGPSKAFVGCSTGSLQDGPGGYGVIAKDGWTEVALEAGVLVRAERPLKADEEQRPPAVLVTPGAATAPVDVHTLIDGGVPKDALLFARPSRSSTVTIAAHVLEVGQTTELELAAPPADFFLPETLEVAVVARRLGLDGQAPEETGGFTELRWLAPEGAPPAPAQELRGEVGERRIRAHFTDPKCPWAERHVGWMEPCWVLEYVRATPLRFRLETAGVKRPGLLSDQRQGYGAVAVEGIYPNGFGGSSTNFDLPPLLIVPKGTQARTLALRAGP